MLGLLLLPLLTPTWDDVNVPSSAVSEIQRRGNLVVAVEGNKEQSGSTSEIVAEVMSTPEDDSYKWYFTLVVIDGCGWCEKMKKDFETHPKLKAWVNTQDWKKSWAHYQVVRYGDQSQAWRWKNFRPKTFPTLIVQPPINGSWGDPKTIVFLTQKYLDPDTLDDQLRKAIVAYAKKVHPEHVLWRQAKQKAIGEKGETATKSALLIEINDEGELVSELIGQRKPPVQPLPKVPPTPETIPDTIPPVDLNHPETWVLPLPFHDPQTVLLVVIALLSLYSARMLQLTTDVDIFGVRKSPKYRTRNGRNGDSSDN